MLHKFLCFLLFSASWALNAQSISRQTIQVAGKSMVHSSGVVVESSVGQPSPTNDRQGFIQPPFFRQTSSGETLKVYPSPTAGLATIEFSFKGNELVTLTDEQGRLIQSFFIPDEVTTYPIDLTGRSAGKFYLQILRNEKQVASGTLIKIR